MNFYELSSELYPLSVLPNKQKIASDQAAFGPNSMQLKNSLAIFHHSVESPWVSRAYHTPQPASGGLTFPNFRSFPKLCWWHALQILVMYICIFARFRSSWCPLVPLSWRFRLWWFNFTLPLLKSIQDSKTNLHVSTCLEPPQFLAVLGVQPQAPNTHVRRKVNACELSSVGLAITQSWNDWNVSQLSSAQRTIQSILHPFSFERRLVSIDLEQRHLFWQQKMQKLASDFLIDRLQDMLLAVLQVKQ